MSNARRGRHARANVAQPAPKPFTDVFQACLNAPEPAAGNENGVDAGDQVESPEEPANQHLPPQAGRPGMPQNPHMPGGYMPQGLPLDPQSAMAYQNYMHGRGGYPPPQSGMPPSGHHQS